MEGVRGEREHYNQQKQGCHLADLTAKFLDSSRFSEPLAGKNDLAEKAKVGRILAVQRKTVNKQRNNHFWIVDARHLIKNLRIARYKMAKKVKLDETFQSRTMV